MMTKSMKNSYSFYVRRKLQHKFTQLELLEPRKFVKFLKKHSIDITERDLEMFEKDELLQPVLRINIPLEDRKRLFSPSTDVKRYYKNKQVEFPIKGDYQPWKNFKSNYTTTRDLTGSRLHFYHPFQLLQVENILRMERLCFIYHKSYTDDDLQKILKNVKSRKRMNKKSFNTAPFGQIDKIGLLMLLEEPYRRQAFGSMRFSSSGINGTFDSWIKWRNTRFEPHKILKESKLTVNDVRELYRRLVIHVRFEDPLIEWYDLTRIMRISMLKKLRGNALKSQLHYSVCRLLSLFIYDLTRETVEEPDIIMGSSNGSWKKKSISDPFDYSTKKTQQGIIKYYVKETKTRLFLLLEGETEMEVIKKICEKLSIDLEEEGIALVNYDGITNLRTKRLQQTIQIANSDNVPIFIIADNENNAESKIIKIQNKVISKFNYHIWDKDFESDNFGIEKILEFINNALKQHDQKLSKREISKHLTSSALLRAIELAFRDKYCCDIFKKIPKKPDISLELMKSHLQKMSKTEELGKDLPIEHVMEKIFRIHTQWIIG